ncbi:Hsp70 family protein [Pseudonocardia sp. N23]|uniref:Hsp70 family protein n=1 Tax=Pseudonocardia sp. N23 TaxID=1987376 RepID=UPI000BFC5024|nr:Hsp70 family protein [Pseudonocardia sp. N23]GAY10461.1 chaperone protein DnaK [Pseudonocardia sp. N23]
MGYNLGVDLGTTFVAAAVARDSRVEMFTLGDRTVVTPAVVFLREDGNLVTGDAANRRAVSNPDRVAREFKRRLGDPTPVVLGGSPYAVTTLLGTLLGDVLGRVTETEGGKPDSVVLTHPANWGPFRRELFEEVPQFAGLTGPDTVTEPEAAAAHYAASRHLSDGEVIAVYDLGGGTFDATVLRKHPGGIEILGSPEGIERLGGVDFDEAILSHVNYSSGGALAELDMSDPQTAIALARLRQDCVLAKEALSIDSETTIPVFLPGRHFDIRLTRGEFEDMIRAPIESTIGTLSRTLRSAQVEPTNLSAVLLVGGSSRIPLVSRMISEELGRPTVVDAHPKYAVALGAATLAAASASGAGRGSEGGAAWPGVVVSAAPEQGGAPFGAGAAAAAGAGLGARAASGGPSAGAATMPPRAPGVAQGAPGQQGNGWGPPPQGGNGQAQRAAAGPPPQQQRQQPQHNQFQQGSPPGPPPAPGAPGAPQGGGSGGGNRKVLAIVAAVVVLLALAGGGTWWALNRSGSSTPTDGGASTTATAATGTGTAGGGTTPVTVAASVPVPSLGQTIPAGKPAGFAVVSPSGRQVYVANRATKTVTVIDTSVNKITATIPVDAGPPQYLAFAPDGKKIYVSIWDDAKTIADVAVIDTTTNSIIANIKVDTRPFLAAVTPDGSKLWVPNHDSGSISIIDTSTNTVVNTLKVAPNPHWIEFSTDGTKAYTANHESNVISVLDVANESEIAQIPVDKSPHSLAVNHQRPLVANVNYDSNTVTMISTDNDQVVARIPVGKNPQEITWAPDGRFAYVVNVADNTVSVISADSNSVTATLPVGLSPTSVAVTPDGRTGYVTNLTDGTLSMLNLAG